MKKAILVVLLPFLFVSVAALSVYWWDRGALPGFRPTIVDVTVGTITRDNRGVRIKGTAHYAAKLKQHEAGEDGRDWYLFPLFAKGDTTSRTVRVLVRTLREPNSLYTYEELTVEGLARPPGRLVPRYAEEALLKKGYGFEDGYVVVEEFPDG